MILLLSLVTLIFTGCTATPDKTKCIQSSEFEFYEASVPNSLGGSKTVYMLKTAHGDVEVTTKIHDDALNHEWEQICYSDQTLEYQSAVVNTHKPEPIIEYVDREVEVPVIEYVDREVEVPVIEYVDVEVEVPVEVIVHTHDLIDPSDWVAADHPTYYYFLHEDLVHLVYTKLDLENETFDMYLISILFDTNLVFSDQVMISSITHYTSQGEQGTIVVDTEFQDTGYDTIEEYVEAFILDETYEEVVANFNEETN